MVAAEDLQGFHSALRLKDEKTHPAEQIRHSDADLAVVVGDQDSMDGKHGIGSMPSMRPAKCKRCAAARKPSRLHPEGLAHPAGLSPEAFSW